MVVKTRNLNICNLFSEKLAPLRLLLISMEMYCRVKIAWGLLSWILYKEEKQSNQKNRCHFTMKGGSGKSSISLGASPGKIIMWDPSFPKLHIETSSTTGAAWPGAGTCTSSYWRPTVAKDRSVGFMYSSCLWSFFRQGNQGSNELWPIIISLLAAENPELYLGS